MTVRRTARSRRGAVLALAAATVAALAAMSALAIDVGMLINARSEAQRAADAAALAGASAFRDLSPALAPSEANTRAIDFATRNTIRRTPIEAGNVTVEVLPAESKVRVTVTRPDLQLWFARLLGLNVATVSARAAAEAQNAGAGRCVKPFALPDFWNETSAGTRQDPQDLNGDKIWDADEGWNYEPQNGDTYAPFDPDNPSASQTGLGSGFRNGFGSTSTRATDDYGRLLTLKAQDPQTAITSGFFYPFRLGDNTGGADYRATIATCSSETLELGTEYDVENGNMIGPTRQGVDDLIAQDPGARWNPTGGSDRRGAVEGSSFGDWRNSPRVIAVPLFDPGQIANIQSGGNLELTFNNIALFFVEGFVGNGVQAPLQGRFLYYASGSGPSGPNAGSLVKVLRLVE